MRFHTLDSRKIPFADYWHLAPVAAPFLWAASVLRIPITLTPPQAAPSSFRELVVDPVDFSDDAVRAVTPLVAEANLLGFVSPLFQQLKNPFQPGDNGAVALRSADGSTTLQITWVRVTTPAVKETCTFGFTSKLADGSWLVTGKKSSGFAPLPWVKSAESTAPLAQMWELHQQRLAEESARQPHVALADDTAWEAFLDELETRPVNHRIERGIYVPVTDPVLPGGAPDGTAAPEHSAELFELHKLQGGSQGSSARNLAILGVTLLIFFGASLRDFQLNDLLILIGVLIFHEAGHFLAMRMLGYRNVQMFFIPFLGAAVSGRHVAAAGWKKAVVSLMGPLPGIAAGIGLTIWAIAVWDMRFIPIAAMLLLINGLNLAPLMPLDGGWFLHAILFGRNRWSEAAFRAVTGVALAAAALAMHTKLLALVGVMIAISASTAWHVATVARKLRGTIPPPFDGDDAVPDSVAGRIIGELKAAMPKTKSPKVLAQLAMQVYDKVHAARPSALASFGFGGVYAVSLVAALVFGCLAIGLKVAPDRMRAAFVQGWNDRAQMELESESEPYPYALEVPEEAEAEPVTTTTAAFRLRPSSADGETR